MFDAFISYKHCDTDQRWALWLHRRLESYRPATGNRKRRLRIFRDSDELSASSSLSASIKDALDQSRFLIVVCSPRTPSSHWVTEEVRYFQATQRGDRVIALLVEGDPSESLPSPLTVHTDSAQLPLNNRANFSDILAADARPRRREWSRTTKRLALLRILARLLDHRFDDLRQRDNERRRRRRFAVAAAAALSVMVLSGVAWFAYRQRLIGQSRAFAAQAEQLLESGDQAAALALALRAWATVATEESHLAIAHAFPRLLLTMNGGPTAAADLWFSAGGDRVIAFRPVRAGVGNGEESGAAVWNAATGTIVAAKQPFALSGDGNRALYSPEEGADVVIRDFSSDRDLLTLREPDLAGRFRSAQFSPDGRRIVTMGNWGESREAALLWDGITGRLITGLEGSTQDDTLVFSPSGSLIATATAERLAAVWNGLNGGLVARFESRHDRAIFSPDGRTLLTVDADGTARVRRADSGAIVSEFRGVQGADAAFSPDGRRLAVVGANDVTRIWSAKNSEPPVVLPHSEAKAAKFSPNGRQVVTIGRDDIPRVWDVHSGRLLVRLRNNRSVRAAFSPEGDRVVTAGIDGNVRIWSLKAGHLFNTLADDVVGMEQVRFSRDGGRLVTAGTDNRARVWNARTGELLTRLDGHTDRVVDATFSPDGQHVITASYDHTARIWNVFSGRTVRTLDAIDKPLLAASFSRGGTYVVTAGGDGKVRVWSSTTGEMLRVVAQEAPFAVFLNDDDHIFIGGRATDAGLLNWRSGELVHFHGHENVVSSVALASDGKRLATAAADDIVRIWTLDGTLLHAIGTKPVSPRFGFLRSVAFSPDGEHIVTSSGTVNVWIAATGQLVSSHSGASRWAEFSPDGRHIAVASLDGPARILRHMSLGDLSSILEN